LKCAIAAYSLSCRRSAGVSTDNSSTNWDSFIGIGGKYGADEYGSVRYKFVQDFLPTAKVIVFFICFCLFESTQPKLHI
jgi:hypothetical protein